MRGICSQCCKNNRETIKRLSSDNKNLIYQYFENPGETLRPGVLVAILYCATKTQRHKDRPNSIEI